ncbi:hypothetical protein [Vitreoscilla filiformis]|uniref:hypothetical protein n=1 Tax=Vitreoscilla filiformis TaxID=63 RepID=UPI0012FE06B2|nr:hypothetical protein [Vitreoscilla filiformis]
MLHLMSVPTWLASAVQTGSAYVQGAMVKDAVTHQVLAHLQPTQSLLSTLLSTGVNGLTSPVTLVSSLAQNAQLWGVHQHLLGVKQQLVSVQNALDAVQHTLGVVQVATFVGVGLGVLNLGASIGGFALTLNAIRRTDRKLDQVMLSLNQALKALDELHHMAKSTHVAQVVTILERAEEGFDLPARDQRMRWLEVENRAHTYINLTLSRLAGLGVDLKAAGAHNQRATTLALPLLQPNAEAAGLLTMLIHLTRVRSEALLCLQRPQQASELAREQIAWFAQLPTDTGATARALLGNSVPPRRHLKQTIAQAHLFTTWVQHSHQTAQDRAALCAYLHEQQVDTLDYVRTVRNHTEPEMLILPHSKNFKDPAQKDDNEPSKEPWWRRFFGQSSASPQP